MWWGKSKDLIFFRAVFLLSRRPIVDKERQERVDYVGKLLMMGELPTFFNGKKRKARQGEGRLSPLAGDVV